ncbi:Programmed Cell Death 1 Ligand 2 [Manis pentadactyla]|nr:Programmed Cell Death 1 Ligand 2 [Manis pentadactyla]
MSGSRLPGVYGQAGKILKGADPPFRLLESPVLCVHEMAGMLLQINRRSPEQSWQLPTWFLHTTRGKLYQ